MSKFPKPSKSLDQRFFEGNEVDHLVPEKSKHLLADKSTLTPTKVFEIAGIKLTFVRIPMGFIFLGNCLQMGGPVSKLTARPFLQLDPGMYMANQLTQWELWQAYEKETKAQTEATPYEGKFVSKVSYLDATPFCNWVSQKLGMAKTFDDQNMKIEGSRGICLPEITEWEYSARGGGDKTSYYPYAGTEDYDSLTSDSENELGIKGLSKVLWQWTQTVWTKDFEEDYLEDQRKNYSLYKEYFMEDILYHIDLLMTPFESGNKRFDFSIDRADDLSKELFLRAVRTRFQTPKAIERDIRNGRTTLPIGFDKWIEPIWKDLKPFTSQDFASVDNEEHRRIIMTSIPAEQLFKNLGAPVNTFKYTATRSTMELVNGVPTQKFTPVEAEYNLYSVKASDYGFSTQDRLALLDAACTTTGRKYLLTVPSQFLNDKNGAKNAVAWTFPCPISNPKWFRRQGDVSLWGWNPDSKQLDTPVTLTGDQYFKLLMCES